LSKLPGKYLYLLRNDTPGPAKSRNLAIKLVDTKYAIFIDDDDTLESDHLESLASALNNQNNDSKKIFYCDFKIIEEDRTNFPPEHLITTTKELPDLHKDNIFIQNNIPNSCVIYPKKILQANQFDPELILFEDWQFLLACLKHADLYHLPINSVCIHKSYVAGEANIRRGNVNDEYLIPTTLKIYKKYHSPTIRVRQLRIERFAAVGIQLNDEYL